MHNWQLFLLDGYKYVDEDYFLFCYYYYIFFLFMQDETW